MSRVGGGYTTFRADYAFAEGVRSHVRVALDPVAHQQRLNLEESDGSAPIAINGDIAYFTEAVTSSGWELELGSPETADRDVSPVGWSLCDVVVRAAL